MGKIYRDDLFVWDDRTTRGHEKKLRRTTCRIDKKYSFPYRSIEAWNKLDAEAINTRNIHDFRNKMDNSRHGTHTHMKRMKVKMKILGEVD